MSNLEIASEKDQAVAYSSATLTGYNGSRARVIVRVVGYWLSEAEAQAALDAACEKKRESYCDQNGLDYNDEVVDDRFRGWLGDYQRTVTSFEFYGEN